MSIARYACSLRYMNRKIQASENFVKYSRKSLWPYTANTGILKIYKMSQNYWEMAHKSKRWSFLFPDSVFWSGQPKKKINDMHWTLPYQMDIQRELFIWQISSYTALFNSMVVNGCEPFEYDSWLPAICTLCESTHFSGSMKMHARFNQVPYSLRSHN